MKYGFTITQPETKQQSKHWVGVGETAPKKEKMIPFPEKVMTTVFRDSPRYWINWRVLFRVNVYAWPNIKCNNAPDKCLGFLLQNSTIYVSKCFHVRRVRLAMIIFSSQT